MNNIIGPYDLDDWVTLTDLRRSIKYMEQKNLEKAGNFNMAIKKEKILHKILYRDFVKRYIRRVA